MSDKIVWILGGGDAGWAVLMEGRVLDSGLPFATALRRAERMAAFVEEGGQSVDLRVKESDGSWRRVKRRPAYAPGPFSAFRRLRTA